MPILAVILIFLGVWAVTARIDTSGAAPHICDIVMYIVYTIIEYIRMYNFSLCTTDAI